MQEGTPSTTSVMRWTRADEAFALRYAHARDEGIDRIAELAHDEAAAAVDLPPEKVAGAKLRFDGHRWYAAKLAPQRYGDKLDVRQEISGPNGGAIEVQVTGLFRLMEDPKVVAVLGEARIDQALVTFQEAVALLAAPVDGMAPGGAAEAAGEVLDLTPTAEESEA